MNFRSFGLGYCPIIFSAALLLKNYLVFFILTIHCDNLTTPSIFYSKLQACASTLSKLLLDLFRIAPLLSGRDSHATAVPGDRLCRPSLAGHFQLGLLTPVRGRREASTPLLLLKRARYYLDVCEHRILFESNSNPYCVRCV